MKSQSPKRPANGNSSRKPMLGIESATLPFMVGEGMELRKTGIPNTQLIQGFNYLPEVTK